MLATLAVFAAMPVPLLAAPAQRPAVWLLNADDLLSVRERLRAGDATLAPALARLRADADQALKAGPFSVTDKTSAPPSGDKHDYMSLGPYWWPDPAKPDGKPYVRRDGRVNPERSSIGDSDRIGDMMNAVHTLALAWFFTGHEPYAAHAAKLLRVWFLDAETRMNPHLRYAQAIPGICEGRGIGIVDTASMIRVVDALGLIEGSPAWSARDTAAMREWFGRFLDWLRESREGKDESRGTNNHSTQYDAQVACYALFTGRPEIAKEVLAQVPARRIDKQVEHDGRQPQELARTKSWGYTCGNLANLCHLALFARHVGVDLWGYQSPDGRSIRKALDFTIPYAFGEKAWEHEEIGRFDGARLHTILRVAAVGCRSPEYADAIGKLKGVAADDRSVLLYPVR